MYVCMHACVRACMHAYMHACMYAYMHTCIVSQRQLRTHFMRCLLKAGIASAATGDRQGYMLSCEYIMLWVAGGCSTVKLYNRIRGDRIRGVQKVTLPYLTFPYLTLLTRPKRTFGTF